MGTDIPDIWPPYEAFYLESLLYCTHSALRSVDAVRDSLEAGRMHAPGSTAWSKSASNILDGVQNIAIQAAALSRYFWPARSDAVHARRGQHLRDGLNVHDESPIRNRELRNQIEHFDEALDRVLAGGIAGNVFPQYVGPFPGEEQVPRFLFRAYFTDTAIFELLGHRIEIQPIVDEISGLHNRVLACCDAGHRIRREGCK
jgi:hypothetical protein